MSSCKQETEESTTTTCKHHWKIGTPNGSVSQGVCRHCGESREFATGWVSGMMRRRPRTSKK
jgi:hypothetical protein